MSWQCFMVKFSPQGGNWFELADGTTVNFSDLAPGAMWWEDEDLVVKLPSNTDWNIDRGARINATIGNARVPQWSRIGTPPMVTAMPSINHMGQYHGWLKDGVLSDDVEGRVFTVEAIKARRRADRSINTEKGPGGPETHTGPSVQ